MVLREGTSRSVSWERGHDRENYGLERSVFGIVGDRSFSNGPENN